MNKKVTFKQIGKAIELVLGNFVEYKFCGKEFEKYDYKDEIVAKSSFRGNTTLSPRRGNYFRNLKLGLGNLVSDILNIVPQRTVSV